MSVPVGADAPSPPTSGVEGAHERSSHEVVRLNARDAVAGVCPYLVSAGGAWRSAAPSREHRCGAVLPAAPQTTDKQRRHCLAGDHVDCPTYRAAREARSSSLAAGGDTAVVTAADARRRPIARTAPIVLEQPGLVDQAMRLQLDRSPGQIALVALMLVAFAIVAIARFSAGSRGDAAGSAPPAIVAVSSSPSPTARPSVVTASAPADHGSAGPSSGPSFRTTYTVKKGDTLSAIASRYQTTAAELRTLNGLKSNSLHVGQVLKIP